MGFNSNVISFKILMMYNEAGRANPSTGLYLASVYTVHLSVALFQRRQLFYLYQTSTQMQRKKHVFFIGETEADFN